MLDVHPAHHAATGWKEFFVHIATIVLGLLIAVGLEQTVEYIHHRRELSEARRALGEEKAVNIDRFHSSAASFRASSLYLKAYLATLRQSIKDPTVPLPAMRVPVDFVYSQYTAWTIAQRGGGLALMPSEEQSATDRMYVGLRSVDEREDRAFLSIYHAEAIFMSGLDPRDLTLEQKRDLYRDASEALADVSDAMIVQRVTVRFNPEFGDEASTLAPDPVLDSGQ